MAADLPKRPLQHVSGDRAVALVHTAVPKEWIVRDQSGDYGIDVEVEYAQEYATGRIFKGQVKGHQSIGWTKDDTFREPIRTETLAYWRELAVPVVVFSVDHSVSKVFWSPTVVNLGGADDVVVRRSNGLPETADQLIQHVLRWRDSRSHRAALLALPFLDRRLRQKFENDLGYDSDMAMEEEEIDTTQELYEGIIRLRQALGLREPEVLPWQLWVARTKRVFGDVARLYWGIHDELVLYVKPLYEEAFEMAKNVVIKEPPTPDNAAVRAYVREYRIQEVFPNPLDQLPEEIWAKIEAMLEAKGALKFSRR